MNIYVISDLHLGHKNIIHQCNRPFSGVNDMDKTLLDNWNSVVNDDDMVIMVGDFATNRGFAREFLNNCNGKVTIVKGNHDDLWYRKDMLKHEKIYKVVDELEFEYKGINILFSHYPKIAHSRKKNTIKIFGHCHNHGQFGATNVHKKFNAFNASVEVNNYTPVRLYDICKSIVK